MSPAMIREGKSRARQYRRQIEKKQITTALKAIRKAAGMGQKELAAADGDQTANGRANGNSGRYQVIDAARVCEGRRR